MIRSLFVTLLAFFAFAANAQVITGQGTATLSWTPPTTYVDGNPLPASEISQTRIFYGTQSCVGLEDRPGTDGTSLCYSGTIDVIGGTTSSTVVSLTISQDTTFYFRAAVQATNGIWGAYSNEPTQVLRVTLDNSEPAEPRIDQIDISMTCTTDTPGITCTITTN